MHRNLVSIGSFLLLLAVPAVSIRTTNARADAAQSDADGADDQSSEANMPRQIISLNSTSSCVSGNCNNCCGSCGGECDCESCGCGNCGCGNCGCQCQDYTRCLTPGSVDPYCRLFPQDGFFSVRGWLDAGILGNTSNPASHFNGPYNSQEVDNGQFNQAYIIMERGLAKDGSLSLGGRVDLLYGSDYFVAQSNGLERTTSGAPKWNSSQYYGLALPQAYLEAGTSQASLKMGHFYTIVGYESVQAANNFFYSHAYSYQFAGPFTQWGGLANWQASDNWQTQFGLVNGWNTLSGSPNQANFLGSLKYTSDSKDWWSSFAIITGDQPDNPANLPGVNGASTNRTRYSFIVSRKIGSRAEYVFHQWAGADSKANRGAALPSGTGSTSIFTTALTTAGGWEPGSNGFGTKTAPASG